MPCAGVSWQPDRDGPAGWPGGGGPPAWSGCALPDQWWAFAAFWEARLPACFPSPNLPICRGSREIEVGASLRRFFRVWHGLHVYSRLIFLWASFNVFCWFNKKALQYESNLDVLLCHGCHIWFHELIYASCAILGVCQIFGIHAVKNRTC